MSRSRKSVRQAFLDESPEPTESQVIAKIVESKGSDCFGIHLPPSPATFTPAPAADDASSSSSSSSAEKPDPNVLSALDVEVGLALMPAKFKNVIWVKNGMFVIASPCAVVTGGKKSKSKVTHDIVHILSPEQVTHLKKKGLFPSVFDTTSASKGEVKSSESTSTSTAASASSTSASLQPLSAGKAKAQKFLNNPLMGLPNSDDEDGDDGGLAALPANRNRRQVVEESSSSEDEDEDDS